MRTSHPSIVPHRSRRARIRLAAERGATSLEYAIVAAAIAAVIVLAVAFLGHATSSNFNCTGESYVTRDERC
jgi:Flp pilus assembly pilin Flp